MKADPQAPGFIIKEKLSRPDGNNIPGRLEQSTGQGRKGGGSRRKSNDLRVRKVDTSYVYEDFKLFVRHD